jgi:hypothetical protein
MRPRRTWNKILALRVSCLDSAPTIDVNATSQMSLEGPMGSLKVSQGCDQVDAKGAVPSGRCYEIFDSRYRDGHSLQLSDSLQKRCNGRVLRVSRIIITYGLYTAVSYQNRGSLPTEL